MKTRLSGSIGQRISEFDDLDQPTVEEFNVRFYECPISNFDPDDIVSIGELLRGDRRAIKVGGVTIEHKMYSDSLYGMDRDDFNSQDTKEVEDIMGYPV